MITSFDDYCIHQTALPVAEPSQSDRNFYDRYWFNGIEEQNGDWLFAIGFGLYPNRRVMDAHFSVAVGSRQYAFHASRRAPKDRAETVVGPLSVQIIEPLRQVRVKLDENEHGISCDLLFSASSVAHQEPPSVMHDDGHLIMHNTRFTQLGNWTGHFCIDGKRTVVDGAVGTRDKSWGIRPVGEPVAGAPGLVNKEPGVYWLWNPINYGSFCTQMCTFEDREGNPTQLSAELMPLYENLANIPAGVDPESVAMSKVEHQVEWMKGTRRARTVAMQFTDVDGKHYDCTLNLGQRFYMLGIGYNHAEWGHAFWKGELVTGREDWDLDAINELDHQFNHIQQVCKAELSFDGHSHRGIGTFESMVIGRHRPSGFEDLFDGAR